MTRPVIWTPFVRRWLYEEVIDQFGPYNIWDNKTTPNDKEAYEKFLAEFAEIIGAKSANTVRQQINFAIQRAMVLEISTPIKNGNAFEMGFLNNRDLEKSAIHYEANDELIGGHMSDEHESVIIPLYVLEDNQLVLLLQHLEKERRNFTIKGYTENIPALSAAILSISNEITNRDNDEYKALETV